MTQPEDRQILICFDGSNDAERAVDAADALLGPRHAVAPTTWQGTVDVADELDAAIIAIGSRGLSGLRELARSSVSHDVAMHARRPMLIVPPPPTKRAV